MDSKVFLSKFGKAILCVVIIASLFLPFAETQTSMTVLGQTQTTTAGPFKGIDMLQYGGMWGYLIFLGIAVILIFEFVKSLNAYRGVACLVASGLIIASLALGTLAFKNADPLGAAGNALGAASSAIGSAMNDLMDTSVSFQIGFFIAAAAAVLLLILSVWTMVKKDKPVPVTGTDSGQGGGWHLYQPNASLLTPSSPAAAATQSTERTEKVLDVIAKLADLRDRGVITDEEFAYKKAELLNIPTQGVAAAPVSALVARAPKKTESVLEVINKLADMNKNGILTDEEFAAKKTELLNEYTKALASEVE